MPDISGITGANGPDPIRGKSNVGRSNQKRSNTSSGVGDSVEISPEGSKKAEAAELLSRLKSVPEVRQARIDEIQTQIKEGTYNVDEKIGQAIDGLLNDIGVGHIQ